MTTEDCVPLISVACAAFAALLFATAAAHKARNLEQFKLLMGAYQVLPEMLTGTTTILVVAAESLVSLTLAFEHTRSFGALLGIACLVAYSLGIATNLLRGRTHIDCGCGVTHRKIHPSLLIRNALLIGVLLPPLLTPTPPASFEEMIAASAAGMMMWATSILLSQIWQNTDRAVQLKQETAQ